MKISLLSSLPTPLSWSSPRQRREQGPGLKNWSKKAPWQWSQLAAKEQCQAMPHWRKRVWKTPEKFSWCCREGICMTARVTWKLLVWDQCRRDDAQQGQAVQQTAKFWVRDNRLNIMTKRSVVCFNKEEPCQHF